MAWELQALRIFRYQGSGASPLQGRTSPLQGRTSPLLGRASPLPGGQPATPPAALTPGQSLARLLQTDPAALRARHDELQSNMLVQAAGHGMFLRLSDRVLVKQLDSSAGRNERQAYAAVKAEGEQLLEPFTSHCFHAVERDALTLLYVEDLTAAYVKPCIMDIKLGTRTFLESDVGKPTLRLDLVQKMLELDPSAVSAQERREGITKMRYMQFREATSSSASLGWRIEGIQLRGSKHPSDCKQLREPAELAQALLWFLQGRAQLQRQVLERLEALQLALEASIWFVTHEVVSSSLLFIYDDAEPPGAPPGVWMIDFAKTVPVPGGAQLTHRDPWELGNHEDGYLLGLESLIGTLRGLECGDPPGQRNGQHAEHGGGGGAAV